MAADLFLPSGGPVDFRRRRHGRSLGLDALIVTRCETRQIQADVRLMCEGQLSSVAEEVAQSSLRRDGSDRGAGTQSRQSPSGGRTAIRRQELRGGKNRWRFRMYRWRGANRRIWDRWPMGSLS